MRAVCQASSSVMSEYFVDEMARIVDEEKSITHQKMAEKVEAAVFDERLRKKIRFPSDVRYREREQASSSTRGEGGGLVEVEEREEVEVRVER